MINNLIIYGIDIPIEYVSAEEINERYKESPINLKDIDALGLAVTSELRILIRDDMHLYQTNKTLMHEAIHLLIEIKNELIGNISDINFHEMIPHKENQHYQCWLV